MRLDTGYLSRKLRRSGIDKRSEHNGPTTILIFNARLLGGFDRQEEVGCADEESLLE